MSKRSIYICENEWGDDPCEFAIEGRKVSGNDVIQGIDGKPKCPGKTQSGKECGSDLVSIVSEGRDEFPRWLFVGGGALAILILVSFIGYWVLSGGGEPLMKVEPATLIFPRTDAGTTTVNLRVLNNGNGDLLIERIEANSPVFSTSEKNLHVKPDDAGILLVHFTSPSSEMTEGELLLYSNAKDSPTAIRLIANQDPWWVYQKLEKSSKILSREQ